MVVSRIHGNFACTNTGESEYANHTILNNLHRVYSDCTRFNCWMACRQYEASTHYISSRGYQLDTDICSRHGSEEPARTTVYSVKRHSYNIPAKPRYDKARDSRCDRFEHRSFDLVPSGTSHHVDEEAIRSCRQSTSLMGLEKEKQIHSPQSAVQSRKSMVWMSATASWYVVALAWVEPS